MDLYQFASIAAAYGIIAHLIGDYVLQNQWMANEKTDDMFVAMVHGFVYGLPFLLFGLVLGLESIIVAYLYIAISHAIIDHMRVAKWWCQFFGIGVPRKGKDVPPFLSVWLMIIVDNTLHIVINTLVLLLLGAMALGVPA